MESRPVLVLGVNETLLDVNALAPLFEKCFREAAVLKAWFARMLLYSQTATLAGPYVDFATLGKHALRMMRRIRNVALTEADVAEIGSGNEESTGSTRCFTSAAAAAERRNTGPLLDSDKRLPVPGSTAMLHRAPACKG